MMKLVALAFLLFTLSLFGQPSPLNHNRWTTNADATILSGSTLTNIPQAAVTGLVGAYQATNANLTGWSLHRTNDYYPTNVNLQAGSTVLTNYAAFGTNFFIPQGISPSKGMFPVFNGSSWVNQNPLTGTRVVTTDPSSATGISVVTALNADQVGTGSSLPPAVLTRGSGGTAVWQVPSATTNGTNIAIYDPTQLGTNVNAQINIKNGASVTNLHAYGTTATAILNATSFTSGSITSVTLVADNIYSSDTSINIQNGKAAIYQDGSFSFDNGIIFSDGGGELTTSNLVANFVDSTDGSYTTLFADNLTTGANLIVGDLMRGTGATNFVQTMIHGSAVTTNGNGTLSVSGGGGSSSLVTSNVLYVAKNGNDTTGRSNRLDLPFLTLTAAQNAWTNGYTIHVFPGTYNEALPVQPDGIKWFFDLGGNINYTGSGLTNIFTITNGFCTVGGFGSFTNYSTNFGATVFYNNGGNLSAMGVNACATNNQQSYALWAESGTSSVNFFETMIGYTAGVYWKLGECTAKADAIRSRINSTAGGIYAGEGASGNLWVSANEIDYITIYNGLDDARVWVDAKQVNGAVNHAGCRFYLIAQKLNPFFGNPSHVDTTTTLSVSGGKFWGNIQKIGAGQVNAVHISSGETDAWLSFNSIEDVYNSATELILVDNNIHETTPGRIYISGQEAVGGTNANGLSFIDAAAAVDISRIDTSASADGKNPILFSDDLETSLLTIGTSQLIAAGTNASIFTATLPTTVTITGRVTANTAKDDNITVALPAHSYP